MALISGSQYTVVEGTPGAWFTASGSSFLADVDTTGSVVIETRRDVSDTAPKPLADGISGTGVRVLNGPCSALVISVASRQYRFVSQRGSAIVAADQ